MIILYIALACLIAYGFLFGYRLIQSLQQRVSHLESEKQEMESLLLTFMESMNDLVKEDSKSSPEPQESRGPEKASVSVDSPPDTTLETATEMVAVSSQLDVEDVLLRHSVRDAARLLGKGEGEMALYAKLRKK